MVLAGATGVAASFSMMLYFSKSQVSAAGATLHARSLTSMLCCAAALTHVLVREGICSSSDCLEVQRGA